MHSKIFLVFSLIYFCTTLCYCLENELLGCFKNVPPVRSRYMQGVRKSDDCASICLNVFYRYINFYNGECMCSNFLGEQVANVTCNFYCSRSQCANEPNLTNVYLTGNRVPGPPNMFRITNITNSSCRLQWQEPESYVAIDSYVVKAVVLKTFSSYPPHPLEWFFGNTTFHVELPKLLPTTKYNISVAAVSEDGTGAWASQIVVTKLASPENLPLQPRIESNEGSRIVISLLPVSNNNGPISSYRIIVRQADDIQVFQENRVLPYKEAMKLNLTYYVAAEIPAREIDKKFIVGDGKVYGPYYNAPLDAKRDYNILVGLVSSFNGETKVAYSEPTGYHNGVSILNVYNEKEMIMGNPSGVIIGLSVAIGLLTFLFLAGLVGFVILKSRIISRRQRLSDNQELTLQGPMIEVENNGYIHEEDHIPAVTHYRNLRQKVRTIPANQVKIEPSNLLGVGKFGKVNTGTLHENDSMTTVTCYSIYDKKMSQDTRRSMLQELDVLIKVGEHDNVVKLLGTSETRDLVVVVIEHNSMNLKDYLLGSRDNLPGKFSSLTEAQAVDIALGICKGMIHLHASNVTHKQLCARSVLMSDGFVPKIGSFGLAQYFSHNKIPDYTRWTALEVFKGQKHNDKSDVWSFACVLWEIAALGGTPYGAITCSNDIPANLSKGVRLPQLSYFSDDLYQIMLDCWQLIPDERPKFTDLLDNLQLLRNNQIIPALSFNIHSNFQYEQFYPNMELSVRPIF